MVLKWTLSSWILTEEKICDQCDFAAKGEDLPKKHHDEYHSKKIGITLEEDVQPVAVSPKPLQLFKCDECTFFTTTDDELEEHTKGTHLIVEKVEYIRCEICQFETQDDIALTNHIEEDHEETLGTLHIINGSSPVQPCQNTTPF